jgi:hypothetical protein
MVLNAMKNKRMTNLLIVFLAALMSISSNAPTVLCLGDNGHVEIEMVAHSVANPLSLSFTNNPGSFCHTNSPNHTDDSCQDEECSDNETHGNDCENCLDLMISYEHQIKSPSTDAPTPILVSIAIPAPIQLLPKPVYVIRYIVQPPDIVFHEKSTNSVVLLI